MSWSRCTTWPENSSHIACIYSTPRSTFTYAVWKLLIRITLRAPAANREPSSVVLRSYLQCIIYLGIWSLVLGSSLRWPIRLPPRRLCLLLIPSLLGALFSAFLQFCCGRPGHLWNPSVESFGSRPCTCSGIMLKTALWSVELHIDHRFTVLPCDLLLPLDVQSWYKGPLPQTDRASAFL